jgi:hypothetical protein
VTTATQKQQHIEELTNQIKQQKENQIKLKKFLFDLEKEYRNLTDTRIALEIKHETLNNQTNNVVVVVASSQLQSQASSYI